MGTSCVRQVVEGCRCERELSESAKWRCLEQDKVYRETRAERGKLLQTAAKCVANQKVLCMLVRGVSKVASAKILGKLA